MLMNEKKYTARLGAPALGRSITLKNEEGSLIETSPVVDYMIYENGSEIIKTHNSIYRAYSPQVLPSPSLHRVEFVSVVGGRLKYNSPATLVLKNGVTVKTSRVLSYDPVNLEIQTEHTLYFLQKPEIQFEY